MTLKDVFLFNKCHIIIALGCFSPLLQENEMIFDEHNYAAAAEEDREAMLVQTDKRKGNSRYRNSMPIEDDQTT